VAFEPFEICVPGSLVDAEASVEAVDCGGLSADPGSELLTTALGDRLEETRLPLPDPSVGLPSLTGVPDVGAPDVRSVLPRPLLLVEAADGIGMPLFSLRDAGDGPPKPLVLNGAPDAKGVSLGLLLRVRATPEPLVLLKKPLRATFALLDIPALGGGVPDTPAVVGLWDTLEPASTELPTAELSGGPLSVDADTPAAALCVLEPAATLPSTLDDPPMLPLTGCTLELMLAPGRPPLRAPEGPGGEPVTMLAIAPPPLGTVLHATAANGVSLSVTPL
jgi:hypothetical protein